MRPSLFQPPRGPAAVVLAGMALLMAAACLLGCVTASSPGAQLCPPVSLDELVESVRRGEKVVFVDVREPGEYAESHIPGAINLPARDMDESTRALVDGARYVVPYCLKDFRGFEGGKRLCRLGVERVSLIEGFGISTWQKAKLPLAGFKTGKTDEEALAELRAMR